MVMDATQSQQPSPQSVGREFVRQYYTLLNKAPNHLHRFYNNHSSFIHGESTLVVGQKNIHNRIQQLNFHDCHAKISQVDAQATLGNGVVVQVTGELSNDGQPMRRFTQTFVLAAQSPKKYYVHNDIFRYQDLYSDEENDGESRSENDEEHDQALTVGGSGNEQSQIAGGGVVVVAAVDQQPQVATQVVTTGAGGVLGQQQQQGQAVAPQQQHAIFYPLPAAGVRPVPLLAAPQVALGAQFAAAGAAAVGIPAAAAQVVPAAAAATAVNGGVSHDDMLSAVMPQANAGQPPILTQQAGSMAPVAQAGGGVPVAAAIIAAQTPAGIAPVPLTNANASGLPPNAGQTAARFQQSPLMQQQIMQQPVANAASQQPVHQAPAVGTNSDLEENISSNTITLVAANSDVSAAVRSNSVETTSSAPIVDDFKTINEQQQQEKYEAAKQQQQQQNEPKTYANLFKSSNSSSPSGFVNAGMQQQQQAPQQLHPQQSTTNVYQSSSTMTSSTFSQSDSTSSMSTAYSNRNNDQSSLRMDNSIGGNSQGGPLPQRNNMTRMNKDFEQRRTSNTQQFGDNQQLFLGNIPHHASEDELKALFTRFGNVLELRILSKPGGKAPPGLRNPLNYGFITYDDPDSVQNCLANLPLYFPENSPDRQKLNVEEKKPRMRSNDMPPRQSGMGSMNNNGMNNSQRNNMSGGPQSRSLSNSGGGMMRNNNTNMSRGGSSQRIGGAFNRNDRNTGPTNGPQVRSGGNNNNNAAQSTGGSYGGRR